jgi:hypothetical protein
MRCLVILITSWRLNGTSTAEMAQNLTRMATATDYREEGARIRGQAETIGNKRDSCVLREAAELCDVLADRAMIAVGS